MRPRPSRHALTAALLSLMAINSAPGDVIRDFRAEVAYEDNLSNSDRAADRRGDFSFAGLAQLGYFGELAHNLRFTLTADLDTRAFAQYGDFNQIIVGGSGALRYRFGLGAMAPFLSVEANGGYARFQQDLQDGGRYRVGLRAGKRLTERLAVEGSYFFEDIGAQSVVFDRPSHVLAASARFDVTEKTRLSLGYEFRDGEVVSYAVPPRPDIVALANAQTTVTTFGRPYVAYNLDAMTHTLGIGLSQALTKSLALNFRYEWQYTSRADFIYTGNVLTLSARTSF